MNFYQKYEVERLIADGEIKSFRAIENATGRAALLHMFNPEGQGVLAELKSRLAKDPGRPTPPLIELGEFAGSPYAVTEALVPFKNLRDWLECPAPAPEPAKLPAKSSAKSMDHPDTFQQLFGEPRLAAPAAPSTPPPREQGEFTRHFGSTPAADPQPKPLTPSPPRPQGEFTRYFGSAPASDPQPRPPSDDEFSKLFGPAPEKAPPPKPDSDEFTKMFGAPKPGSRPPAPAPDPETGQFTRLFGSGPSGEAINIEEEQARAAKFAAPESRPFEPPSEFTRVFGRDQDKSAPAPAARPLTIGNASGIFKAPAPSPIPSVKSPAEKSPGGYTRMIARGNDRQPAPPPPSLAQPVVPVPVPKRGMSIAIAVGVGLLLLALFAVVVIVLQKRS